MALISCRDVSMTYENTVALRGLSFDVESGDYLCILGENGSGKSTLIKGLLGLKAPTRGVIAFGDGLRRNEIGYLPQQTQIQREFPACVSEVVLSGCLNHGISPFYTKADRARAHENIQKLELSGLENRSYRELSGGQQQRVLLARALCATRKLLLLDEPVSGLDPVAAAHMYGILAHLNHDEGITIVMVSHDVHGAAESTNRVLHLATQMLFYGSKEAYFRTELGRRFMGTNNMGELFTAFFNYAFLTRALTAGILIALCAALLGVSLVLKNYALIGDGLSHVGFGALAVAAAANLAPLAVAVPVVIAAAFLLLRLRGRGAIRGDSAIALVSTSALALGVIVSSVCGMNTDLSAYLFGSILSMSRADVTLSAVLCGIVLVLFIVFYNKIFTVTFDESFARATGTHTGFYDSLLAVLTAVTVVLGMRLMGTLLISSLIIFPALSAMRVCRRFKSVVIVSAVISALAVAVGLGTSYSFQTPAGASIVAVNAVVFAVFALCGALLSRRRARVLLAAKPETAE